MNATMNYTAEMATYAAGLTFRELSASYKTLLSVWIIDMFAVMLAGAVQPTYRSALEATKFTYGSSHGKAIYRTIDGTVTSLSGQMYMMGIAAGDFEFDHVIQASHPSSSMFPALLCVAAAYHKSGKDFLTAMSVGYEFATRIGYATREDSEKTQGFHAMINGDPATAAAVGNLMGWDADTISSAMGLAASSSSGLLAFVTTEAMTRRTHPASQGQHGAEAALLAKAGILGPMNIMENRYGYLNAFATNPKPEYLIEKLGSKYESADQTLKALPVHAKCLGFAYAVDQYRQKHTWDAADISNITLYAGPFTIDSQVWNLEPTSLSSAQYSVPFGIVASLIRDLRNPLNMNDALVKDKTALELTANFKNVTITDDPEDPFGYVSFNIGEELVNITMNDYPGLPGSDAYAQVAEDKYEAVLKALGVAGKGGKIVSLIKNLAHSDDVSELLEEFIELGKVGIAKYNGNA